MIIASILLAVSVTVSPSHMGTVTATETGEHPGVFTYGEEWFDRTDPEYGRLFAIVTAAGDMQERGVSATLEINESDYDTYVIADRTCRRTGFLEFTFPGDVIHRPVHKTFDLSDDDYPHDLPYLSDYSSRSAQGPAEYRYAVETNWMSAFGVYESRLVTNVMYGTFRYEDNKNNFVIKMKGTRPSKVVFSFQYGKSIYFNSGSPGGADISVTSNYPSAYVRHDRKYPGFDRFDVTDIEFEGVDGETASATVRMEPCPFEFSPVKSRYLPYGFGNGFNNPAHGENLLLAERAFRRRDGGANIVTNAYTATYRQAYGNPIASGGKIVRATFRQHTNDVVGVVVDF